MGVRHSSPNEPPVYLERRMFPTSGRLHFWMVVSLEDYWWSHVAGWLPARVRPAYMHLTEISAEREAERLALQSPGGELAILEATKIVSAPTIHPIAGRLQRIPRYEVFR